MNKRKKLKETKTELTRLAAEESITIESFLANYLGLRDNNALSNKMSHKDIKALIPQLVRTSFDYVVDNPDLVYTGEIILIEDDYGSIVPYYDPTFVYVDDDYIGEYSEEHEKEEIPNINDMDITTLSNYELQKLLHIYEQNGIRSAYRKVRNELLYRKDSRHSTKESKERVLRKARKNERFDY